MTTLIIFNLNLNMVCLNESTDEFTAQANCYSGQNFQLASKIWQHLAGGWCHSLP